MPYKPINITSFDAFLRQVDIKLNQAQTMTWSVDEGPGEGHTACLFLGKLQGRFWHMGAEPKGKCGSPPLRKESTFVLPKTSLSTYFEK